MKKKVSTIIALVVIMASTFVAFSSSYDLKNVFLTRDEWEDFEASMNTVLANIEVEKQESVQGEVGYQMYRRDILARKIIESMRADIKGQATLDSWSIRRSKELEDRASSVAPPSP